MGIAPNTELYLLKGIPLDSDYTNTIKFKSATNQHRFFTDSTRVIKHFYNSVDTTTRAMSYIQKDEGVLCVGLSMSQCFNCNYIAFKNNSHEGKWFYAFVTKVEYANEKSCYIHYEIDVMQTWMFDYNLGMSFIERQHHPTDKIGDNLVPENLECGQYNAVWKADVSFSRMLVAIVTNKALDDLIKSKYGSEYSWHDTSYPYGKTLSGVFNGLYVYTGFVLKDELEDYRYSRKHYNVQYYIHRQKAQDGVNYIETESLMDATTMIELITESSKYGENSIVAVYQYPAQFSKIDTTTKYKEGTYTIVANVSVDDTVGDYTPKNKKLLTDPYKFIRVSNNTGETADYRIEDFTLFDDNARFNITGTIVNPVTLLCTPTRYRGLSYDYDSGIALSNFPVCTFKGDAYTQWLVENRTSVTLSAVSSVIGAIIGVISGGASVAAGSTAMSAISGRTQMASSASSGVFGVGNKLAKIGDLKNTPPQIHGQINCETLVAGMDRVGYSFYEVHIKPEFARIIDDYFTMYGYATHTVDIPNITSRPHWNYIKTINANILPTSTTCIPSDDLHRIRSVYDHGITFWHNGDEIGDYSFDNSPIATYTIEEET